jgi:hypothetical protein
MSHKGWVGVMKDGNDRIVPVGAAFQMLLRDGIDRKHRRVLEGMKNVLLPVETVARLVRWKIFVENKTLAATYPVTLGEKFVGHDVNSAGIAVAGEKFVPRSKSVKGGVVAVGNSLVEFLRVI